MTSEQRSLIWKTHRCTPSCNRIPALCRREPIRAAADRAATCDICKGLEASSIQPGIEESQRGLAARDQEIVDKGDDRAGGGRRRAGPVEPDLSAIPRRDEVETLCGNVGICAALGVEEP